jgi:hypothetical protein
MCLKQLVQIAICKRIKDPEQFFARRDKKRTASLKNMQFLPLVKNSDRKQKQIKFLVFLLQH